MEAVSRGDRYKFYWNETKFYSIKGGLKQNEISSGNISKFFHRHLSVPSTSFENSCDDGKSPLGVFNAARV